MKCVKDSELSKPACQHISCHGTPVDYGSKTMCCDLFWKKEWFEEDWPQQHIEGIASRGGSQRRDTQSQELQALHIHKIRESRNKSIQKPLRRRFLLTLIRLWSDNLTEIYILASPSELSSKWRWNSLMGEKINWSLVGQEMAVTEK
jgi:hypothetical protein